MKRVLITGAKGKFAEALSQYFESKGYGIWQPGDSLDMFVYIIAPVSTEDESIEEAFDYDGLLQKYEDIALDMLKETSKCLNHFRDLDKARLCFVNSIQSSVNRAWDFSGGYDRMVSAACNMAIRIMFNRLRPLGYTFRVFAAQDINSPDEASYAAEYFITDRSLEEEEPNIRSDENRIVMRDMYEVEIPW